MLKQEKNLKLFNLKFLQLYLIYFFKKSKFINFFSNFLIYKNNNLLFLANHYFLNGKGFMFSGSPEKLGNYFALKRKNIFFSRKVFKGDAYKRKFVFSKYILLNDKKKKNFYFSFGAPGRFWVGKNKGLRNIITKNSFTFYSLVFNYYFPNYYFSEGLTLTGGLKKKFDFNLNLIYYNFFLNFIPKNYFFLKKKTSKKEIVNSILKNSNLKKINWVANNSKFSSRVLRKRYLDLLIYLEKSDLLKGESLSIGRLEKIFNNFDIKNNSFKKKADLNLFIKATKRTVFFTFTNLLGEVKFSVSSNILKTKRYKLSSNEAVYHVLWKVLLFLLQYFKKNNLKLKKENITKAPHAVSYRPKKLQGCYFKNIEVDEQLIWYFDTTFKLKQLFIENFLDISPSTHGFTKKKKKKK